jgi:hypothetical protein
MAYGGQPISIDYFLLNKYIDQMKSKTIASSIQKRLFEKNRFFIFSRTFFFWNYSS